ncbi:hypothetical protein CC85DRAFT_40566 [Cutaneotrichosporon oleaginosum]|uniref:Uncharacterized protein n=1 Tax=Cutaneotrichosporon oleaginosum TaxID=879819 RepID=A0A0J0XS08_9TREE|nr:uncharacterized protein CC85DRAFT_40566 [Cutaneotrichosporon oleaginosum]KLT43870.1 hypothetical protein CC85DRAFT_40566 [Cutaneotrichosporon oleaginosum]TXT06390.1 hypothetical protein COLE_05721 [Cutaneotrichosporon oleaginosum]
MAVNQWRRVTLGMLLDEALWRSEHMLTIASSVPLMWKSREHLRADEHAGLECRTGMVHSLCAPGTSHPHLVLALSSGLALVTSHFMPRVTLHGSTHAADALKQVIVGEQGDGDDCAADWIGRRCCCRLSP